MKRNIKIAILLLLSICISGSVCWYFGLRQGVKMAGYTREMANYFSGRNYLSLQFENGSCEAVKEALLEYDEKLELLKKINDPWYDEHSYKVDKIFGHARLYLVESKLQHTESANKNMELSIKACKDAKWEECTKEKLVWAIEELQKSGGKINCLNK
jgi:hypothetical protein